MMVCWRGDAMPKAVPLPIARAVADSEILSAVLREILALRAEVAVLTSRLPVSSPDSPALSGLLAAIHTSVAGRVFSVGELVAHANLDADLHAAIVGTLGAASGRQLGKALSRAEPVATAFIEAMRPYSVPLRLQGLSVTPLRTRVYVNEQGVTAVRVPEHGRIPVLKGDWTEAFLEPVKHAGVIVQTTEFVRNTSPAVTLRIVDDLAKATAEAENLGFLSPTEAGSVLNGAPTFTSAGSTLANVDADLAQLLGLVPGSQYAGATWVMSTRAASFLSLLRGGGGANAFPSVTPSGGQLLGHDVLISTACQVDDSSGIVALLSPPEILWADEGHALLTTSTKASLVMDSDPEAVANPVSMFQSDSIATKAVRESAWYAKTGAGAYYSESY